MCHKGVDAISFQEKKFGINAKDKSQDHKNLVSFKEEKGTCGSYRVKRVRPTSTNLTYYSRFGLSLKHLYSDLMCLYVSNSAMHLSFLADLLLREEKKMTYLLWKAPNSEHFVFGDSAWEIFKSQRLRDSHFSSMPFSCDHVHARQVKSIANWRWHTKSVLIDTVWWS